MTWVFKLSMFVVRGAEEFLSWQILYLFCYNLIIRNTRFNTNMSFWRLGTFFVFYPQSLSALHEQVKIGSGELLVYGVNECVWVGSSLSSSTWLRGRAVLGCICERERAPVDHPIQSYQRQRDCDGLPEPSPLSTEHWNIRHNTQHRPRTPGRKREKRWWYIIMYIHKGIFYNVKITAKMNMGLHFRFSVKRWAARCFLKKKKICHVFICSNILFVHFIQ